VVVGRGSGRAAGDEHTRTREGDAGLHAGTHYARQTRPSRVARRIAQITPRDRASGGNAHCDKTARTERGRFAPIRPTSAAAI
jgi:hypothetical protein